MAKKEVSVKALLDTAVSAAKLGAKIILDKKNSKVRVKKGSWDYALAADVKSEKAIKDFVNKRFPEHSFVCEESGFSKKKNHYEWIIDPLDGTINFAHKIPLFSVSICVMKNKEPIVGVIYVPLSDELFHAVKGKGAFLNHKKIKVSKDKGKNKILITGNPGHMHKLRKKFNENLSRYFACSSLELAYVACGRFSARLKVDGKVDPFGNAAGFLLVKEAGGVISDTKGNPCKPNSKSYIASNKACHKDILKFFKK